MIGIELANLDYLFSLYADDTIINKKLKIEYSVYNRLNGIANELNISLNELLEFIIVVYVNEYRVNNRKMIE